MMKTLDEVVAFHGHICPGLALGYRVSELALGELGPRAVDEELLARVENDSCAVDAVQVLTGCTFGKGNLEFLDYGKQVYTFIKRPSAEGIRISVKWTSPEETEQEREAWEKFSAGERTDEVVKVVHDRKSRKIQAIMAAPFEELFEVKKGIMELPPVARVYTSLRCSACGEKVMEPRVRVRDGQTVCLPCFNGQSAE